MMDAVNYLRGYARITERIARLDKEIKDAEEDIELSAVNYDGMPKPSDTGKPTESLAVKLVDLKRQLEAVRTEKWRERKKIEDTIASVDDLMISKLLSMRYIDLMLWDDIADTLHVTTRYAMMLHSKGLQEVEDII